MRYAGMETRGISLKAQILNLSTTGLAFIVDSKHAPSIGEMLKLEFSLPGGRQIAWFATVVRLERKNEWSPEFGRREYTLVGLRFRQLPAPFEKAIRRCVERRAGNDQADVIEPTPKGIHELRMFWFMCVVLVILLALMAIPPSLWLTPYRALFK